MRNKVRTVEEYFSDVPDLTGTQAMRSGGITKLRSVEYRVNTFSGVGTSA